MQHLCLQYVQHSNREEVTTLTSFTIDADQLTSYRNAEGITSNAELARRMGVNAATVSRVLAGLNGPSTRFMTGLQQAFPGRDVMRLLVTAR